MYNKAALMLRCSKKRHMTLPGLLEPAFFFGAGWQIHRNKVQRPEETAQCRNEPIAARRSPAAVKREDRSALGLPMLASSTPSSPFNRFFLSQFHWQSSYSFSLEVFLNLGTSPSLSNPLDTCNQINFSKQSLDYAISMLRNP